MENKIREFSPVVYPFRLWVGVNPSYEEVENKFYALNTVMERIPMTPDIYHTDTFIVARNIVVCSKNDGWIGIFIPIYKPRLMSVGKIAHEASHCTDFMCEKFGVGGHDFEGGEARAYFTEWVADCINQVKTGKPK